MLKFLGRGSAFADEHNSAFFYHNDDLILIDCPESEFRKVKKIELKAVKNIYILITHTHGDHSSGVGTMIQYAWYILHKPVTIVAPSDTVRKEIVKNAPRDTGAYAKGWTVLKGREDACSINMIVYCRKRWRLTHLLEHGHAKRGGGRVAARPHIAPAQEAGEKELEELINKDLGHG